MNGTIKVIILILSVCAISSCVAVSQTSPKVTSATVFQNGVPGGTFVNTVNVTAQVITVDKASRMITLANFEGREFTAKVEQEAVNLDEVKIGDMVKITVTDELVVYITDERTLQRDASDGVDVQSIKNVQSNGVITTTGSATGIIVAIDHKNRIATLRFEDGTTKSFLARPDIDLNKRKVGEKVMFHITEIVALRVEKQK